MFFVDDYWDLKVFQPKIVNIVKRKIKWVSETKGEFWNMLNGREYVNLILAQEVLNNVFKKTQKTMASSMAIIYYNMSNKRDDCS